MGLEDSTHPTSSFQEADGLEWLLRLAVLWQQVAAAPLRRTQQGDFFKRDFERLGQDALLNAAPADQLAQVPDFEVVGLTGPNALALPQYGRNPPHRRRDVFLTPDADPHDAAGPALDVPLTAVVVDATPPVLSGLKLSHTTFVAAKRTATAKVPPP